MSEVVSVSLKAAEASWISLLNWPKEDHFIYFQNVNLFVQKVILFTSKYILNVP